MVRSLDAALDMFNAMMTDAEYDMGESAEDSVEIDPRDIIVSLALEIEDDQVMRELCQTQLGYIPQELEGRLGKRDWLEGVL